MTIRRSRPELDLLARVLGVVALLVSLPSPVRAEAARDEAARRRAAEVAAESLREFNLGQFQNAVEGLNEAYRIYPHPSILFNLGRCHVELGDHERAIFFFRRFVDETPDEQARAQAEASIAASEAALERRRAEAPDEEEGGEDAGLAGTLGSPGDLAGGSGEPVPRDPGGPPPFLIHRQWWFWSLLGIVVAGAVAGTVLGMSLAGPEVVLPEGGSLGRVDWR